MGLAVGGGVIGGAAAVGDGINEQAAEVVARPQEAGDRPSAQVSWYRSWGALLAYSVGGAVLAVLFVRWRTAYLKRRQNRLESLVEERTREVQRRKREVENYNRELVRTNEALRHTVEEKSRLLGMAAHDLKNPLFGIRALSEIVLESEEMPDKSRRKLALIRDSANETIDLIDDLLASAAGTAQAEVTFETVDVASLVRWVIRSFEPQAERKQQAIHSAIADAPCLVEGNKRRLREAVGNLVSNALKYSPPDADVTVRVERQGGDVCVAVSDEGPGLSEGDQQRLFAPFQRLTPEPTGGEGSSGLGLYIVKQVADMHEGDVSVDTALGEGSTFTLVLPAVTSNTDAPVPHVDPAEVEPRESIGGA